MPSEGIQRSSQGRDIRAALSRLELKIPKKERPLTRHVEIQRIRKFKPLTFSYLLFSRLLNS